MPRLSICCLASGSKGNAYYVGLEERGLLLDAGLSLKDLRSRMAMTGLDPANLAAVLVTHEHTDHTRGLPVISRRLGLPVYATGGTCWSLKRRTGFEELDYHVLPPGQPVALAGIEVKTHTVSHDAVEPVCYSFHAHGQGIAVVTDLGMYSRNLLGSIAGVGTLVLESNHELSWLMGGPYPAQLKARISSAVGHLSNEQAAAFLMEARAMHGEGLKRVILGHLSETNNSRKRAMETVSGILARHEVLMALEVAAQDEPSARYAADGGVLDRQPGRLPL